MFGKHKIKSLIVLALIASLAFMAIYHSKNNTKWDRYFRKTLYRDPDPVVVKVAKQYEATGTAIDLGCGAGNDAAVLLHDGWEVWAVDSAPCARDWIQSRRDIKADAKLVTITSKFEELHEGLLPQSELIISVHALPFCDPKHFPQVWSCIKNTLVSGGRFAGHFFGDKYVGFTDKQKAKMTFLTKPELIALFSDFTIEFLEEREEDGQSATGKSTHVHIFEVIARKT